LDDPGPSVVRAYGNIGPVLNGPVSISRGGSEPHHYDGEK
jgi:hypothetical protein